MESSKKRSFRASDRVYVNCARFEAIRQKRALGRCDFFLMLGIGFGTGYKILNGKSVRLCVVKKIATKLRIKPSQLVESWAD